MKKLLLLASFTLVTFFSANAQLDIKGGWAYAFESEEGGFNIGAKYGITPEIDLAAGLTFYFPAEDVNLWMIDIDGHYNFSMGSGLTLYPLAGLNFTTFGFDGNDVIEDYSDTEFGLNLGGGVNFQIVDPLSAFVELKYIIGDADQGVLGVGVAYRIQ